MDRPLPTRRRRVRGGVVLVLVVLAVVVIAYGVWLVVGVRGDLQAAERHAARLKAALATSDVTAARSELGRFNEAVSSADRRTESWVWRLGTHAPFVGDDLDAVARVSSAGAEVGRDALTPIIEQLDGGLVDRLVPRDGRVDLAALGALGPVLHDVQAAVDHATDRLRPIHTAGLTERVRAPLARMSAQLDSARTAVDAASRATEVLPAMLGADGPRRFLLLQMNNAEIRSTGGIPGAFAVIETGGGRVSLGRQGSAADFGELLRPVLPQSGAERAIYGKQPATFLQDVNFVPEFPRSAELARAMYEQKYGERLDGVLAVDTVTLSYLLEATGPVKAGGITLTSQNAVDELLNRTYVRLHDPVQQDAFFAMVGQHIFSAVLDGVDSATKLAAALARGVDEGRVYVHSFEETVQPQLDGTAVAGEVSFEATKNPQLGIYLNDATGAKMSYFLRTDVRVRAERCDAGQQQLSSYIDLRMVKPEDGQLSDYITGGGKYGVKPGQQLLMLRVYGPVDGELSDFRFDGAKTDVDTVEDRGRPVVTTLVQLKPDQTVRVRWTTRTAAGQTGATDVEVTPGLEARTAATKVASAC